MLIALAGLSGAGKTTLAAALAPRLGAAHLVIGPDGPAAAQAEAEALLRAGRVVIADGANPSQATREAWRAVARRAGAPLLEAEIVCADAAERARRLAARGGADAGAEPAHAPWDRPHLVVDTAGRTVEQNLPELLAGLQIY